VAYSKYMVEKQSVIGALFAAGTPGPTRYPLLYIAVSRLRSFEEQVEYQLRSMQSIFTDATVVGEKPSHLRDGTPAREVEFHYLANGVSLNHVFLYVRKGDLFVCPSVISSSGSPGEDLKAMLYSIEFQPEKDKPVKVPPDVQEFLDKWGSAIVAHDPAEVMTYYSDKFLFSGRRKAEWGRHAKSVIDSITSFKTTITDFVAAGDKAYLAGFVSIGETIHSFNFDLYRGTMIIKQNGSWRWYGNQIDAEFP